MVSGFFTSPWDHSRILSGDARLIRMALNESGSFGFSKKLKMSFTSSLLHTFSRAHRLAHLRAAHERVARPGQARSLEAVLPARVRVRQQRAEIGLAKPWRCRVAH